MANTIRIGTFEVSSFKVGLADPKIYLGDILLYPTGGYKVCYAVVDDISQYSDTEFEDVYDKTTEKWYKLNNLNQYEEYGIYGSGKNITYYEGKLTVDDGYEYEWNGSSWANLGEVSGSSRLPQGYTEVEYVENTSSAYINTNLVLLENIGDSFEIKVKMYFTPYGRDFEYLFGTEQTSAPYTGIQLRYYQRNLQYNSDSNVVWTHIDNGDGTSGVTASCSSINATNGGNPLTLFCGLWSTGPWRFGRGKIYSFKVTKNDTLVRDLVPCKRDSDNKYGMYDLITDTFYLSPNGKNFIGGEPITPTEYPKYYAEKSEPLDNLTFNTLAEAQAYAEVNCVYVGLKATIDGDKYVFSGDSISGYEWVYVPSRLPDGYTEVEYIEDSGSQYIDTGVYLDTSKFEVGCEVINSNCFWGYCHQGSVNGTWLGIESTTSHRTAFYGKFITSDINNISSYLSSVENTIVYTQSGVTVNGSVVSKSLTMGSDSIANKSLVFFGRYDFKINNIEWQTNSKFKSFYIKNNGTLVRDFVPAKRDSDNKYGMYDLITDTFYVSPNGNNFIGGDPV